MKKDLKHRLKGKKREPDRTEASVAEERVDPSDSLSRPESRFAASGHDGEDGGTSTDARQLCSRAQSPQPEPAPAGGSDDGERREEEIGGKEVSQRRLSLDPNAKFVVDSGPSQEVDQVHPSPPTPSIPPTGGPDSTQTSTVPDRSSDIAATSAVLDRVPKDHPNESAEPDTAVDKKKSNWKSTMSTTAKLLLQGVRDSADAFGPLKSVAGGLCFILENCEVCPSPPSSIRCTHRRFSERVQINKR